MPKRTVELYKWWRRRRWEQTSRRCGVAYSETTEAHSCPHGALEVLLRRGHAGWGHINSLTDGVRMHSNRSGLSAVVLLPLPSTFVKPSNFSQRCLEARNFAMAAEFACRPAYGDNAFSVSQHALPHGDDRSIGGGRTIDWGTNDQSGSGCQRRASRDGVVHLPCDHRRPRAAAIELPAPGGRRGGQRPLIC